MVPYKLMVGQLPSPRSTGAMMNLKPSGRRASSSLLLSSSPASSGLLLMVCFVGCPASYLASIRRNVRKEAMQPRPHVQASSSKLLQLAELRNVS